MAKKLFLGTPVLVLALVFGLVLAGCPADTGGGGVSLPSAENISAAPAFPSGVTDLPTSASNAEDLFRSGLSALTSSRSDESLYQAERNAVNAASAKLMGDTTSAQALYLEQHKSDTSISGSGDLDQTTGKIKVTGSSAGSMNLPCTLGEYVAGMMGGTAYVEKTGDKTSSSRSDSRTYTIGGPGNFQEHSNYKIAGIITAESDSSSEEEYVGLKDKDTVYNRSSDSSQKWAYTLTISNGSRAAKFRFSIAWKSDQPSSPNRSSSQEISDLEVYDNTDKLLYTIGSSSYSTISLSNIASFGGF